MEFITKFYITEMTNSKFSRRSSPSTDFNRESMISCSYVKYFLSLNGILVM